MTGKLLEAGAALRKDERGMTLIEVMTALVILTMVTGILFSFLLMGVSMFKRVTAESQIRNQGDALTSSIIAELKDAVFVTSSGERNTNKQIEYVKRDANGVYDANVKRYRMSISLTTEPYGIVVEKWDNGNWTMNKRLALADAYTLKAASSLQASEDNRTVEIDLSYSRYEASGRQTMPGGNPEYAIRTKIPLIRPE